MLNEDIKKLKEIYEESHNFEMSIPFVDLQEHFKDEEISLKYNEDIDGLWKLKRKWEGFYLDVINNYGKNENIYTELLNKNKELVELLNNFENSIIKIKKSDSIL